MRSLLRRAVSPRWRTLSILLVLLAFSAIWAGASGFWLVFRVTYVLALLIPAAFLVAWANLRRLEATVQRRTERAQVGQEAQEVIEVRNRGFWPKVWLEVDDPSTMPGHQAKRVVVIPPRRSRNWLVETPLLRRGLYEWGPLQVTGTDPFGVFRLTRTFGEPQQILVYPPVYDIPHFQAPPANLPGEGRFRRRTHYVTPNASGIREYQPGDSLGRIHWPSTARTGDLMVKTFELDPASDVWVVLDLERRVHAGKGDESTEEYAVRVAASVARHYLIANRSVGLLSFGRDLEIVEPERGPQQLTRILESLALAQAVGDVPLGNLLLEEQRRFGRHTTLVVVTASTDDHWLPAALSLAQRGVRMAVVLIDPSTFGDTRSPLMLYGELTASDIPTYVVAQGDDLMLALSAPGGVPTWQS